MAPASGRGRAGRGSGYRRIAGTTSTAPGPRISARLRPRAAGAAVDVAARRHDRRGRRSRRGHLPAKERAGCDQARCHCRASRHSPARPAQRLGAPAPLRRARQRRRSSRLPWRRERSPAPRRSARQARRSTAAWRTRAAAIPGRLRRRFVHPVHVRRPPANPCGGWPFNRPPRTSATPPRSPRSRL